MARSVWQTKSSPASSPNSAACGFLHAPFVSGAPHSLPRTNFLSVKPRVPGALSGVATPLPIPNREVKHSSADGSYAFGCSKSRPVPGTLCSNLKFGAGRTEPLSPPAAGARFYFLSILGSIAQIFRDASCCRTLSLFSPRRSIVVSWSTSSS